MSVRPAKTQISLGIHPVWSESLLSAWRKLGSLATYWARSEDWSDSVDAQADLSLRLAHTHFVGFVMLWLIYFCYVSDLEYPKDTGAAPLILRSIHRHFAMYTDTNEPSHAIMELFVLRKLNLQTRMHGHPLELDVWSSSTSILHVCEQSEPSLFAYAIRP